ncbi:MAG: transcription termination factor Rho [Thermoleophilaceae bacterium]|nr:transcription termination factor Rho [Thermoleophilaceae bacterium]
MAILDRKELEQSPLADLHAIASELGIEGYRRLRKEALIDALMGDSPAANGDGDADADGESGDEPEEKPRPARRGRGGRGRGGRGRAAKADEDASGDDDDDAPASAGEPEPEPEARDEPEEQEPQDVRSGMLDVLPNGSGFMRPDPFAHTRDDVYVSPAQIRRCELRPGDEISGPVRSPRRSERYPSLVHVETVNGQSAEPPPERPRFEDLTPVFASERLTAPDGLDAVPFGKGSRVAVGGPPGSGITTLLRRMALTLAASHPDVELTVLLAGVRPEEVTEWRRDSEVTIVGGGFDRSVDEQSQAAETAVERAKRRAESGGHAAIVLDSLDALPPPVARRVFGAARALEEGGSLTVIASTGLAGEPQRLATTRIVLEPGDPSPHPPTLAATSGTLRADRLSA